jgi:hypothetical protein
VGFFSLAATKLPNYVLPAYPALALATACFIDRWLSEPESVRKLWPGLSFGSLALVGATMIATAVVVSTVTIHGKPLLEQLGVSTELTGDIAQISWLGGLLFIGGITGVYCAVTGRSLVAMFWLATTALTFSLGLFAVIAVQINRHQPTPILAGTIREHSAGAPQVAQFGYFQPSLVYYTDTRIEPCKTPQQLIDFLQQGDDSFVVTTDEQYSHLMSQLPADVIVLGQCAEFPRQGGLLVLGRKTDLAQRDDGQAK